MHRTESVDYGIVLAGEVWLVVDRGETVSSRGRGGATGHEPRLVEPRRSRRAWRSCSWTACSPTTCDEREARADGSRATGDLDGARGSEEAVLDALRSVAAPSRQEPGCRPTSPTATRPSLGSSTSSRSTTTRSPRGARRLGALQDVRAGHGRPAAREPRATSSKRSTPDAGAAVSTLSQRGRPL